MGILDLDNYWSRECLLPIYSCSLVCILWRLQTEAVAHSQTLVTPYRDRRANCTEEDEPNFSVCQYFSSPATPRAGASPWPRNCAHDLPERGAPSPHDRSARTKQEARGNGRSNSLKAGTVLPLASTDARCPCRAHTDGSDPTGVGGRPDLSKRQQVSPTSRAALFEALQGWTRAPPTMAPPGQWTRYDLRRQRKWTDRESSRYR